MKKIKYFTTLFIILFITVLSACNISFGSSYKLTVKYDDGTTLFEKNYSEGRSIKLETLTSLLEETDIYINKDDNQLEFEGFKTTLNSTTTIDFPYSINKDTTIYASFYKYYIISFDTDGGSSISSIKTSKNHTISAPENPIKDGYTFDGWYNNTNYDVKISFNSAFTENTTIYAKWNKNNDTPVTQEYSVSFDANNNTEITTVTTVNNKVVKPTDPKNDGYTFDGWYTNNSFTTKVTFNETVTENTTYYAKWIKNEITPVKYTVTFVVNLTTVKTVEVNENDVVSLPSNPIVENYRFDKWVDDDGNTFTATTKITKNLTISAILVRQYTVKFIDEYNTIEDIIVDENTKITLPTLVHDGYVLNAWYTNADKTNLFDENSKINSDLTLYSSWTKINTTNSIEITKSEGYSEGAYIEFNPYNGSTSPKNYTISYVKENETTAYAVDSELIRKTSTGLRCDILGLSEGKYTFTITENNSKKSTVKQLSVYSYDRSGYAHFKYSSGVGAYNDDGTLKSDAVVIYVTEETKNSNFTIDSKTYAGLVKLIQAKLSTPLCIRIIGTINAATWNELDYRTPGVTYSSSNPLSIDKVVDTNGNALPRTTINGTSELKKYNSMSNDINNGITELNNLTNKIAYDGGKEEYDSYFNMCDVSGVKNVTIEGVGNNSGIYQWGFTWSKCNSIEVRNLTFSDNPEDACSFQGSSNSDMNYGHYWVHNCVFNRGKNNWDVCPEQDKHYGDGSIDLKYCYGTTVSYNQFNNCKKTGLVGGSDSVYTKDVSFHHNYYNQVGSRLPLGRQANMHIYNNYYYKCSTCQDIRANAFVLSEANYFESCSAPQKVTTKDSYPYTVIKSYNEYLTGCGQSQATVVTSREQSLSGLCKPDGKTDYTNFDTNLNLFYYDSANKSSKVDNLFTAIEAKEYATKLSGPLGGMIIRKYESSTETIETPEIPETPSTPTTWTTIYSEDFSSLTINSNEQTTGWYYSILDSGNNSTDNTKNYAKVDSGKLSIVDSSDDTTFVYYMFKKITSGKVKISLSLYIPSNGSWSPFTILDDKTNIAFRTNSDKKLGYTVDGSNVSEGISYKANQEINVSIIIDFETHTLSFDINGTAYTYSNYEGTEISGLQFMTAASASRSFQVDNLLIQTA